MRNKIDVCALRRLFIFVVNHAYISCIRHININAISEAKTIYTFGDLFCHNNRCVLSADNRRPVLIRGRSINEVWSINNARILKEEGET